MYRSAFRPVVSAASARSLVARRCEHTSPKPPPPTTSFFAKDKIGIEVTPLIAFVGTLLTIAAGAGIHHLMKDDDLRLKHGDTFIEEKDPVLEKALSESAPVTEKKHEVKPSK